MNTEHSKSDVQTRIRTTALRQAQEIEERKNLQARIADLVVEAFDLPSKHDADPARPEASDASLFKQCLGLFQSTDLDDLIYERNIDNRCGYALCPRPNQRLSHNGELIWNKQAGKDFKLVNKAEMERWCSPICQQRTIFVRAQLGTEPAWLRDVRAIEIKLYDDVAGESLADSLNALSLLQAGDEDLTDKLQALALERGEININSNNEPVPLVEKESDSIPKPPSLKSKQSGKIEGHQPRKVRFHET